MMSSYKVKISIVHYLNIAKGKDAKILIENFLSLSTLQLISYIFPLITLPYLSKILGVEKFGVLAFVYAVLAYFFAFVEYGFNYSAVRDIAQCKNDISRISEIFSTVMVVRFILVIISFVILLLLTFSIPIFIENRNILLCAFIYIPCWVLFPDWLFQAIEKMKFVTLLNIISKLLFTVLVFVFINKKEDYIYQPVLYSLGFFISGVFSIIIILYKFRIKFIIPSIKDITNAMSASLPMFLILFLPNLYTNFSIVLLNVYSGEVALGIFDAGNRFIIMTQQITNVLSRTFYPFLARRMDKHKFYIKMSFLMSILMSIALFLSAESLIRLFYTPEFSKAAIVLKILSLSIVFLFLMNAYGTNYLVLINKEKILNKIIFWCSIGGFGISWIAIIKFSYIGVALTFLIVWGIRGILTWKVAQKYKVE